MSKTPERNYSLQSSTLQRVAAPKLPYKPRDPEHYRPNIGLIACGGITKHHLIAYRKGGYPVVALCDLVLDRPKPRWFSTATPVSAALARTHGLKPYIENARQRASPGR